MNQTVAAVTPFESLDAAKAAGYVPVTPTGKRVVHYINYSITQQHKTADPEAIPSLVYVNTNHGAVLSGAVYSDLSGDPARPTQPGGCLAQWHLHSDLCFSGRAVVGNDRGRVPGRREEHRDAADDARLDGAARRGRARDPSPASEVVAAAQVPPMATPNGTA